MPSLDTAISYHRLKKAPLDDSEVFNSLRDLMDYCDKGASYNGQRVVVLDDVYGDVEYVIKNNIPIIDMRGSEPSFWPWYFDGDNNSTNGMLIYERNSRDRTTWSPNLVFYPGDSGYVNLISQLEIFRISDASSNIKSFKFYLEQIKRRTDERYVATWTQNYNPYTDGENNIIRNIAKGATITNMSYTSKRTTYASHQYLTTNNEDVKLMSANINDEENFITRIYVKADDYYKAYHRR